MNRFFYRYRVALSCGFFLAFSLLLATVNSRAPYRIDPVGVILLEAMYPLQVGISVVEHSAEQFWRRYLALWALRRENEELRSRLEALQKTAQQAAELDFANQRLGQLLALREELGDNAIAARIVGRSSVAWIKTVVLNKGSTQGVTKGMAVIIPEGVLGQVVSVSAHTARVLLVSDPNSAVDVLVQRTRVRGIASGLADGRCILKYVERKEDIQIGDTLITSGLDGLFPKGQLLGTVIRVSAQGGHLFQEVEVKLSADLTKVEEVLVVASGTLQAAE